MIVSKLLIGDGAENYLPFALGKLRFFAAQWTGAMQSHVIQADDGSTIMIEVLAQDRGRVSIYAGVAFVSVGVEGTPYRATIRGQIDHKLSFRKMPGILNRAVSFTAPVPVPGMRALIAHSDFIVPPGPLLTTRFRLTLGFIGAGGQYQQLYVGEYNPPYNSADFNIDASFCHLGNGCIVQILGRQRKRSPAGTINNYEVDMLTSQDDGKTWAVKVPGGGAPLSVTFPDEDATGGSGTDHYNTQVHTGAVQYVGNKTAMLTAYEFALINTSYQVTRHYPKLVRTVDMGVSWITTSLMSALAWAYRCYPSTSPGFIFDTPSGYPFGFGTRVDWLIYSYFTTATLFTPVGDGVLLMTCYHYYPDGYLPGFYDPGYNAHGKYYAVFAHRSTDNGATWDGEGVYIGDEMNTVITLGKNAAAASVVWNGQTYITLTNDGGLTWTRHLTPSQPEDFLPLTGLMLLKAPTLDTDGKVDLTKVRLACMVYENPKHILYYSDDGAQTWTKGGLVSGDTLTTEPYPDGVSNFALYAPEAQFTEVALLTREGSTAFKNLYHNNGPL